MKRRIRTTTLAFGATLAVVLGLAAPASATAVYFPSGCIANGYALSVQTVATPGTCDSAQARIRWYSPNGSLLTDKGAMTSGTSVANAGGTVIRIVDHAVSIWDGTQWHNFKVFA